QRVEFEAPLHVQSTYKNTPSSSEVAHMKSKNGRIVVDAERGIEWRGEWKMNDPKQNSKNAKEFIASVESQFGDAASSEYDRYVPPSGEYLDKSQHRAFGPKTR
ncbi:MAG: hypothetical protein KDD60_02285, partial [Bdellovibrionales bacterium]|nr:hypothetical protein [Bdellovibrionales bacterium]